MHSVELGEVLAFQLLGLVCIIQLLMLSAESNSLFRGKWKRLCVFFGKAEQPAYAQRLSPIDLAKKPHAHKGPQPAANTHPAPLIQNLLLVVISSLRNFPLSPGRI